MILSPNREERIEACIIIYEFVIGKETTVRIVAILLNTGHYDCGAFLPFMVEVTSHKTFCQSFRKIMAVNISRFKLILGL